MPKLMCDFKYVGTNGKYDYVLATVKLPLDYVNFFR